MRSSRRNRVLQPEYTPEPTPPSSNDSRFTQNFQIETTIEEEERIQREDAEERLSTIEKSPSVEVNSVGSKDDNDDINFSSDDSTKTDSSEKSLMIVEEEKSKKSSSTQPMRSIFTLFHLPK